LVYLKWINNVENWASGIVTQVWNRIEDGAGDNVKKKTDFVDLVV